MGEPRTTRNKSRVDGQTTPNVSRMKVCRNVPSVRGGMEGLPQFAV